MKLSRLASTTERHSRAAVERSRAAVDQDVRRVETPEGVEGDRQRSLREEMAEADPKGQAAHPTNPSPQAMAVMAQLLEQGDDVADLLNNPLLPPGFRIIDERA